MRLPDHPPVASGRAKSFTARANISGPGRPTGAGVGRSCCTTAGTLIGWALGFAMVYALSLVRFELSATGQEMTRLPIAWSMLHYAIASAFALGSAAVAGYLPARRAARANPVDIIRGAT